MLSSDSTGDPWTALLPGWLGLWVVELSVLTDVVTLAFFFLLCSSHVLASGLPTKDIAHPVALSDPAGLNGAATENAE